MLKYRAIYIFLKLSSTILRVNIPKLNDAIKKYGYLANLQKYRALGAEIGEKSILINCTLSSSSKGDSFVIGKNCTITGTTLLAHDASPSLFLPELVKREFPYLPSSRLSYREPISIGDNVFIGWGSIVLPGVCIGNNVVVGAGSVVTKNIPDNSVVAGNPAKVIKPIEDYITNYKKVLKTYPERF
ncbi:DapH/DapD/GlmU-related protein [Thalassotalea piscium]